MIHAYTIVIHRFITRTRTVHTYAHTDTHITYALIQKHRGSSKAICVTLLNFDCHNVKCSRICINYVRLILGPILKIPCTSGISSISIKIALPASISYTDRTDNWIWMWISKRYYRYVNYSLPSNRIESFIVSHSFCIRLLWISSIHQHVWKTRTFNVWLKI